MRKILLFPPLRYGLLILGAVVLTALLFPEFIHGLLRTDPFMPHEMCYMRQPGIIGLHVTSDLLIGLSYVVISATLGYMVYKASKDIPFHWMFLAFGLFIITCGFTHFMEVWTVWQPVYWLAGYIKLVCAAASVATAIALVPLVPKIFALIGAVRLSEQRRVKLESANRELEAFAYTASHDLRAPLRAVRGMAQALTEDFPHLDATARAYVDRMAAASERMDQLICDLLEYSRVARVDPELKPVDLKAAITEAQAAIDAEARQRQAAIITEGPLPTVLANPVLLTQVLANLLGNAVKFVAAGVRPQVRVFARDTGRRVRLCVQDNGIGIAPEYQRKIFGIFERLHSGADYPGTGVGLAIVEKAVSRMQGELGLESTPGQGSCFWVELPKA